MDGRTKTTVMADLVAVMVIAVAFSAMVPVKPAQAYDEATTVSCYVGNPEDGNYVGDLTLPDPENSGRECNSLYAECQGECSGCFSDSDITQDICYDSTGKKFLQ